jgi:hypothetical protein
MPQSANPPQANDPEALYEARVRELESVHFRERRLEKRIAIAKLAAAFLCVLFGCLLLRQGALLLWIFAPAAALVFLIVYHENLLRRIRLRTRRIDFYLRGLDRLRGQWAGKGENGLRFLDEKHPYARDLDLFGAGSLFELLFTSRTRAGEETLAAWLLTPAQRDEILARQQAIDELKEGVSTREELFLLGTASRAALHPEKLAQWGEKQPLFQSASVRGATRLLAVLWLLSLIFWAVTRNAAAIEVLTLCNLLWARKISARADEAADQMEEAAADLRVLAGLLAHCESQPFEAAKLTALQSCLHRQGRTPSSAIAQLERITRALENRRNLMLKIPDLLLFWSAQLVFAAERWQRQYGPEIRQWMAAVGEFEALHSLAAYAYEHSEDPFAEIVASESAAFTATALAHPLLPRERAVSNDVALGDGLQLMVLSGPNMAGKSTFIRSIGINAVLALCGAPVRARSLRIAPLQVAASICILDSLAGGISRFYAEIYRVKLIADLAREKTPVLFLLDELLSGTNSGDRLAGTEYVVRSLLAHGAAGIVSTHDLALTRIPDGLDGQAANFHFEDRLEEGRMLFDYKLKPGVVQTSNALKLMRSIGLVG